MSQTLLELVQELPRRQYDTEDVILDERKKLGFLAVLESGSVEIVRQGAEIARVMSPGAILGEVSMLLDRPHMATVRALEPTTVFLMEDPAAFLQAHPEINVQISRILAYRLSLMTNYLADLKNQFGDNEDHLGMIDEVLVTLAFHQGDGSRRR